MTRHEPMSELLDAMAAPPAAAEAASSPGGAPGTLGGDVAAPIAAGNDLAVANSATGPPSPPAGPNVASDATWLVRLATVLTRRLADRVAADRVELAVVSPEGLWSVACHDERSASPRSAPGSAGDPSASLAAHALSSGKTVLTADVSAETRFSDTELARQGVVSAVAAPVWLDDRAWGVIVAGRRHDASWSDDAVAAFHRTAEALGALVSALGSPDWRSLLASASLAAEPLPRAEQRSSRRRTYRYRQHIAPIVHGRLPEEADFFEVECRDLSQGGVSLVLDAPPEFDEFVIALGTGARQAYLRARVVNIRAAGRGGYQGFIVGCRFLERIEL